MTLELHLWMIFVHELELRRFLESDSLGVGSFKLFGRSCPGVGVLFLSILLTEKLESESDGVGSYKVFDRSRSELESPLWGIVSPLSLLQICMMITQSTIAKLIRCACVDDLTIENLHTRWIPMVLRTNFLFLTWSVGNLFLFKVRKWQSRITGKMEKEDDTSSKVSFVCSGSVGFGWMTIRFEDF